MTEEELKKITLEYLSKTYPNQNHLHKDTEKTFENYMRCRSFKDFYNGLKKGISISEDDELKISDSINEF